MTPERKAWWDSLPKEEKRVRMDIELCKKQIKWRKAKNLNLLPFTEWHKQNKFVINYQKRIIKALRKQIGLCPIDRASRNDPTGSCPTCNDLVIRREHDCCAGCGQKLRWE